MKHVRNNIYEQGGTFYELESTTMSENKITADFRQIDKFKTRDLRFKCVLADAAEEEYIKKKIGIKSINLTCDPFLRFNNGTTETVRSSLFFSNWEEPIIEFKYAIMFLENMEKSAPEFDIKLRDDVLIRATRGATWEIRQFARIEGLCFKTYAGEAGFLIVKYAGNEHLHGTKDSPTDGWWEAEAGKPVWVPVK